MRFGDANRGGDYQNRSRRERLPSPEATSQSLFLHYTGGEVPTDPTAWLRVLTNGTRAQRQRAWAIIGIAVALPIAIAIVTIVAAAEYASAPIRY